MILLTDKINTSPKGGDGGFAISIGSGVYIDSEYFGRIYGRTFVQCGNCAHWNAETHKCVRNPSLEPWYENDYCSYGVAKSKCVKCEGGYCEDECAVGTEE